MKRMIAILVLAVLLLCGCSPKVKVEQNSIVTKTGTIVDQAMARSKWFGLGFLGFAETYFGIVFEDGSVICVWNKNDVPCDVGIGDKVDVTYGIQENSDTAVLIDIKEVE